MLALLLLLSQQLALAHAVTHIGHPVESNQTSDNGLPDEMQCIKCAAFASVGSAVSSTPLSWLAIPPAGFIALAGTDIAAPCGPSRLFDSRAPPIAV